MTPPEPEAQARQEIDALLEAAGWFVCDYGAHDISRPCAIREFPLKSGHGHADYLLYLHGKAVGVVEAKKVGYTLKGVEVQSAKYTSGLPDDLPSWERPLPFAYESTGKETQFTNNLDPEPRSRRTFAFHKPAGLSALLDVAAEVNQVADEEGTYLAKAKTFLGRMQTMPPLIEAGLWGKQAEAVKNIELSLKDNRPRSLLQMATGSGKTYTAITQIYRLIKFGGARRVLFLVDRGNLAEQTEKEFQQYKSPYNNYKFTEEFIVQRLQGNTIDTTARVCICTIQRLYSMLSNNPMSEDDDEASVAGLEQVFKEQPPIEYNPNIPIESFDIIITDECHRSIYNLWAQVLEYFDAYLIGLTAISVGSFSWLTVPFKNLVTCTLRLNFREIPSQIRKCTFIT